MQELNNPEHQEDEVSTIQDALVGKKRNTTALFSVGGVAEPSVINVEDLMTANGENEAQNRHLNKRRKLDTLSSKIISFNIYYYLQLKLFGISWRHGHPLSLGIARRVK